MKKKLIVVADDFGFSEAYNYGVIKAYKEGIVTALSLMSNMAAAPHAVQLWRSEQKDDPKCKGDIYPTYEDFYTETMAQLERHKELTGRYPNHFEGHSAMTKPMDKAFADVGEKMGIHNMAMYDKPYPGIRQTFELLLQGPAREKGAMEILNRGSLPEDFFEDRFCLLDSPHEINILHFHPGYLDQYLLDNTSLTLPRCRDLQTLCDPSVRRWLEEHEIELVDFNAVYE